MIDGGTVKHWSSTQATIALSVGVAEYYALVKAAAEGLAMVALGRDLGYELNLRIWVDSTTATAIVTRLGLGKVCHMEVKFLCGSGSPSTETVRNAQDHRREESRRRVDESDEHGRDEGENRVHRRILHSGRDLPNSL